MSGEFINANSIEEYWNELKIIYERRSTEWKDLTPDEYLPDRMVAYHIELHDDAGNTESRYFQIKLKENIE